MIAFAPIDDASARADWAELIKAFPAARVHADARWLEVVARAFGVRATFVLARDSAGAVRAGVAGYYSRNLRGRRLFYSLRQGVLTRDPAALSPLISAVEADSRLRGCSQAVVGGGPEAIPGPYRESVQTTLNLDLGGGVESLWAGFGNKVRNTIRRAERSGLQVSHDLGHLSDFHAIYARAMTDRHANVRELGFFRAIFEVFGHEARLYTALADGRACGAMVVVSVGGYAAYLFGAFDEQGRHMSANTMLLWHVTRELIGEGVVSLDLGPSKPDSGAYRFKRHIGGVPQKLHYVDLLHPPQSAAAADSSTPVTAVLSPLDRTIGHLPFALRKPVRTWLGRTGRLL